ncbi:MAG: hypothetical protein N2747_04205 [Chitinophagaceae bacterium]|nr:hypothetical protein [Chitinophagaceae bacterium]
MSNPISAVFISAGIYFEGRRIKNVREILKTRQELKELYGYRSSLYA